MGRRNVVKVATVRLMLFICSLFICVLCFLALSHFLGQAGAISAVIPVVTLGWLYGVRGGVISALFSFPVNSVLTTMAGTAWTGKVVMDGGGIVGALALLACGAVVGHTSDLRNRLKRQRDQIQKQLEQRERAEEARASNDHLENIFKMSADGILITDGQGCITMANAAAETMLGYNRDELIGKHPAELTPEGEEYIDQGKRFFEALAEKGIVMGFERTWLRKDRSLLDIEVSASLLKDSENSQVGGVISIRDITSKKQAEEELIKTKDYLDNIIDSSLDGITVSDNLGHVTRVNRAFLELIGFSEEEVVGKHIMELSVMQEGTYESTTGELVHINEEFFNTNMEMTVRLYEEGRVSHWESYYLRKDKRIVPVEMKIANLYNKQGDNTGAVGISRDITERRIAEKEIRDAKEFLENIFRTTTDGILVTDNEGVITVANESAVRILGYALEEIIGKEGSILKPPGKEHDALSERYVTELQKKGMVTGFEFVWAKKDGTLINVEANAALLRDRDGAPTGAVSTIRDSTERIKTGKEIKEARDFLKSVIENSRDAILITDAWGTILSVNAAMEEMSGFTKEELTGEHTSSLFSGDDELNESVMKKTEEMYETGYAFYNSTMKAKDGKNVEVECSCSLIREEEGNAAAAVAIMRDVTERKHLENRLHQSEKLKSLGELAGGVAHDFNNVLAAILGRVQLLKLEFTPPEGQQEKRKAMLNLVKSLEIIERASLDGAETVRRIQEFARQRSDDKHFTQLNINELLDNALEFTGVRWKNLAESEGIHIEIKKEFSPLSPTTGSASELREVFTNLINNALDAMPHGGRITLKTVNEGDLIAVTIEDTGIGIPEAIRNRIFDPFFTTKGVQSTGLGMSISYGIINRHKGTIAVESGENGGTIFTIKLPIREMKQKGEGPVNPVAVKNGHARVLVIEDEKEVGQLLQDILTSQGHQVDVASDGRQGLALFKDGDFDLVFTDLGMPSLSGWQVAEEIKSVNRKVPVAVITGWGVDLDESEMREKGIHFIVQKPFQVDQVVQLVEDGLALKHQLAAA